MNRFDSTDIYIYIYLFNDLNKHLRQRDNNDNIIEFKSLVLKLILNVDVTATSTFWWPTVNWEHKRYMHDWNVCESAVILNPRVQ